MATTTYTFASDGAPTTIPHGSFDQTEGGEVVALDGGGYALTYRLYDTSLGGWNRAYTHVVNENGLSSTPYRLPALDQRSNKTTTLGEAVALEGGGYVVSYLDPTGSDGKWKDRVSVFDSFGASISNFVVNENASNTRETIALAGGGFAVMTERYVGRVGNTPSRHEHVVSLYSATGTKTGELVGDGDINEIRDGYEYSIVQSVTPHIAQVQGGFVVVSDQVQRTTTPFDHNIHARLFVGGTVVDMAVDRNATSFNRVGDVVAIENGFVVTYLENYDAAAGSSVDRVLVAQRFDLAGEKVGGAIEMSRTPFGQEAGLSEMLGLSDGRFVVVLNTTAGDEVRLYGADGELDSPALMFPSGSGTLSDIDELADGRVAFFFSNGDSRVQTFTLGTTITGDDTAEIITGSSAKETILGLGSRDDIDGGGGADSINGGLGQDVLAGGAGVDRFFGSGAELDGDIVVEITEGETIVVGSETATIDMATLNAGTLSVTYRESADGPVQDFAMALDGATGSITFDGRKITYSDEPANFAPVAASDVVFISRGATALFSSSLLLANDTDPDGDALRVSGVGGATAGSAVQLDDGAIAFNASTVATPTTAGFSYTVSDGAASASASVSVKLVTTTAKGDRIDVSTTAGQFSWIDGQGGNDVLTGDAGNDTLIGGAGLDTLHGWGGSNLLVGGADNDKLFGDAGIYGYGFSSDTMFGGSGNDTYFVDVTTDVVREDSTPGIDDGGIDLVYAAASFTLDAYLENLNLVPPLVGNAHLNGTGNDLGNKINGNSSNNVLTGLGGNDALVGGAGFDTLRGGSGMDTLTGGADIDDLDGGEDGDTYNVDASDTVFDSGTTGTDRVVTNTNFTLAPGNGVENLRTTYAGNAAGTGKATLIGNELANLIEGAAAPDILQGREGNDTLKGNGSNDTLTGGLGRDNLTGGDGADTFVYAAGDTAATTAGFDIVTDFVSGTDRIDLSIFTGANGPPAGSYAEVTNGTNSFPLLKQAADAELGGTVKAVFVAAQSSGWLFWDTNSDGTADEAIQFIGLNDVSKFAASDMI